MGHVFISYAREDRANARALADALSAQGVQVWWDRELGAGDEFAAKIEEALDTAAAVIVLWSDAARKSYWVRDEAAVGRDRNRLIPLALDDRPPPLGFRQIHTPQWNPSDPAPIDALWQSLRILVGLGAPKEAAAAAPARTRGPVVAGVNAAPNNKSIQTIKAEEKRQRSFISTFWMTSFVISGIMAVFLAMFAEFTQDNAGQPFVTSIVAFLWVGVTLVLGRFLIVVGRRLSKRKSVRYFDGPTLICTLISAGFGLAMLSAEDATSFADKVFVALLGAALVFPIFALFSIPIGLFKGLGRTTFEDGK